MLGIKSRDWSKMRRAVKREAVCWKDEQTLIKWNVKSLPVIVPLIDGLSLLIILSNFLSGLEQI